jgi:hypothetical protein
LSAAREEASADVGALVRGRASARVAISAGGDGGGFEKRHEQQSVHRLLVDSRSEAKLVAVRSSSSAYSKVAAMKSAARAMQPMSTRYQYMWFESMRAVHVETDATKHAAKTATMALTHRRLPGVSRFAVSKAAIHVRERERYATMPKDAPSLNRHSPRATEDVTGEHDKRARAVELAGLWGRQGRRWRK